jgi:mannose-6-phosphate isomerase-like protein (cupin superfamily)
LELIEHQGRRYALILRRPTTESKVQFFTPDDSALQVGAFNLPAGHEIQPHIHLPFERRLDSTQEVLVIQSGRLQVDFYDDDREFLCSRVLAADDVIVLFRGGHGFRVLEPLRMLEVKQGPYAKEGDKARFARPDAVSAPDAASQET